jgi:hypothetical protein
LDMSKRLIALGSSTFLALAGIASAARATVVDTFSFSNLTGWSVFDTHFSGTFTGALESDGLIELSDLSAFHIFGFFSGDTFGGNSVSNLTFFSYDTQGGASSLGFIASLPSLIVCAGAPSVLSPTCTSPGGSNPGSTLASIVFGPTEVGVTPDLTDVTLVSSVTTPETSTWTMMVLGFAGLGCAGYFASRKAA